MVKFEDWIKTQFEYEHLLRKYGDTIFIKHNGEYQRFEVRLASKAFDKDKPKDRKRCDKTIDFIDKIG